MVVLDVRMTVRIILRRTYHIFYIVVCSISNKIMNAIRVKKNSLVCKGSIKNIEKLFDKLLELFLLNKIQKLVCVLPGASYTHYSDVLSSCRLYRKVWTS